MKKRIILLALIITISALFFIPVTQHESVSIKAPIFNIYSLLLKPGNWKKWRADLRKIADKDSTKISTQKNAGSFVIKYQDSELEITPAGEVFNIDDDFGTGTAHYSYIIVPDKDPYQTVITVYKNTSAATYFLNKFRQATFADTHIGDLKNYLETDSLHYGCNIVKIKVPENNLIEIKKRVLAKDKFTAAAQSLTELRQYIKAHHIKQMQPVIAQFIPRGKDSAQVNVGFFVDKGIKSEKDLENVSMPKGGPLYGARFSGKFNQRQKIYNSLQQYFTDHHYQTVILPFETYLDDKLPAADTDKVNIRVNFSSYF